MQTFHKHTLKMTLLEKHTSLIGHTLATKTFIEAFKWKLQSLHKHTLTATAFIEAYIWEQHSLNLRTLKWRMLKMQNRHIGVYPDNRKLYRSKHVKATVLNKHTLIASAIIEAYIRRIHALNHRTLKMTSVIEEYQPHRSIPWHLKPI